MPKVTKIRDNIKASVLKNVLSHAVLFEGEKGTGKMDTAIWLSKLLLCQNSNAPCLNCQICQKIESGNHPDVTIVSSEGKKSIGIDDIRKIKEGLYLSPVEGKKKIYIIPEADSLTIEAQNAFLKSLEEPPENVHFVLLCESKDFLLDTIQSRTSIYTFDPMSIRECQEELLKEFPERNPDALKLASLAFAGSYGQALEMVEKGNENCLVEISKIPLLLRKGMIYDAVTIAYGFSSDREELRKFLEIFSNILVKSAVEKTAGRECLLSVTPLEAVKSSELLDKARTRLLLNGPLDLIINWLFAELANVFGGKK